MRMMRRAGLLNEKWNIGSYSGYPQSYTRPNSNGLYVNWGSSASYGCNPTSNNNEATFRPGSGVNYGYYLFSPNINVNKIKNITITCKVKASFRGYTFSSANVSLGIYDSINNSYTRISSQSSVKKTVNIYTLSNINTSSLTALNLSNLCIEIVTHNNDEESLFFGFDGADLTINYEYK